MSNFDFLGRHRDGLHVLLPLSQPGGGPRRGTHYLHPAHELRRLLSERRLHTRLARLDEVHLALG